ncbi:MAG: DUF1614 domain-containing protein [Hyphomicrobiales bacterium]|nr:DUF1614 domain-containing protein [Hyphomicrobiales bacterium]
MSGPLHYLPLSGWSFTLLAAILAAVFLLVQFNAFRFAYMQLGLGPRGAFLLLAASLVGSYFNIPVTELAGRHVLAAREISFYGMRYVVPFVQEWRGTVIAVNVGGALIPVLMSVYLLLANGMWLRALVGTLVVTVVCHQLSNPVPGLGIAEPVFVPALTTAAVAFVLGGNRAAPLAYVCGSLGTLLGADILNLGAIPGLGAPVASIGGAGTFDGIFLIGIVAVLLASLPASLNPRPA